MTYIGRTWLYWRNLTSIGRIWLLPAEYDLHWQNMVYTGWLSLLPVEFDLYWQNMTSIGRIWFILAYCHSYWQNMQPIKSVLPFCSADSIYPRTAVYCSTEKMAAWHVQRVVGCSSSSIETAIQLSRHLQVAGENEPIGSRDEPQGRWAANESGRSKYRHSRGRGRGRRADGQRTTTIGDV